MLFLAVAAISLPSLALGAATYPPYANPSVNPQTQTSNYGDFSNGTIHNTPVVKGAAFDRYVQIVFENTDYLSSLADPNFQKYAKQGILFNNSYAVVHPSMPNYVALVAGSSEGYVFDDLPGLDFPNKDASVTTIVDILEAGLISWGAYLENLPFVGYRAVDYTSRNYNTPGGAPYNYYARRHSGLHKFDSVMTNQTRVNRLRTMNNFADDLVNGTLPAWSYITPNVLNDGHDTTITYAGQWLDYFLSNTLNDTRFNGDGTPGSRTLVLLTFDESDLGSTNVAANNQILTIALGSAVPTALHGTVDSTYYTHYSALSTVEANWGLGNLGRGDATANVYKFVADAAKLVRSNATPPVKGTGPNLVQ